MKKNNHIILKTEKLSKKFKNRWAVKNLNLNVYQNDIYGFLGPNGAGKSTTIRMIVGLISPTKGKIFIDNQSCQPKNCNLRNNIRSLIEKPNFYEYLSGLENMKILARLSGIKEIDKVKESLKKVGLFERRHDKVKTYSLGMKQRLGIAQTIIDNPDLIILDEPTNGLDPQGIREIRKLIYELNNKHNITFFISSHILHEIENTCNRMAIINKGKLLAQGKINKLLNGTNLEDYFISLTDKKKAIL